DERWRRTARRLARRLRPEPSPRGGVSRRNRSTGRTCGKVAPRRKPSRSLPRPACPSAARCACFDSGRPQSPVQSRLGDGDEEEKNDEPTEQPGEDARTVTLAPDNLLFPVYQGSHRSATSAPNSTNR